MRFKAVIFDLDGVLVSTDEQHYQGWKALCDRLGIPFDREVNNRFRGVSRMACVDILEERSGQSWTDERKQEIDFTDPYIDSNQGVVVKADSDKTTAEALNADGVKIACQSGTTGETWTQENLPKATIVSLDDPVQAVTGVSTGIYDAAAADLPVMKYLCSNSFTDCQVAIEIPTGEQYGIVVSKSNAGLTSAINEALAALKDDGTIESLEVKWFGSAM